MSKFHVGQRVRILDSQSVRQFLRGREGLVCGPLQKWDDSYYPADQYRVLVDGHECAHSRDKCWCFIPENLAPLTDPKADEFIERIRKIAREPINVTVKERA